MDINVASMVRKLRDMAIWPPVGKIDYLGQTSTSDWSKQSRGQPSHPHWIISNGYSFWLSLFNYFEEAMIHYNNNFLFNYLLSLWLWKVMMSLGLRSKEIKSPSQILKGVITNFTSIRLKKSISHNANAHSQRKKATKSKNINSYPS